LNNKEPLILAGLFDEETKINSQKIPLLGDIPFIGDLFKQTSKETSQSEILFIITPEIML
jgi:type IV pilus assembly protein PilQ